MMPHRRVWIPRGTLPLLALIAMTGCDVGTAARVTVPADSAAGETAFRLAGPAGAMLLVAVEINGRGPYDLVLDTGATLTCVDETVAMELELPRARGAIGYGAGVGSAGPLVLVRVDSVRLGAAQAEGLTACVLDLQHLRQLRTLTGSGAEVHGLLGLNFLKNFRVTLDFDRQVVSLH